MLKNKFRTLPKALLIAPMAEMRDDNDDLAMRRDSKYTDFLRPFSHRDFLICSAHDPQNKSESETYRRRTP